MVPAESMLNLESRPFFLTISLKTPSAAGLLQMLPRQTNRTEKGLVSVAAPVDGSEEAIDAFTSDPKAGEILGSWWGYAGDFGFWRDGYLVDGKSGIKNEALGESKWEWWQNCKYRGTVDDDSLVVVLLRDGLITSASVAELGAIGLLLELDWLLTELEAVSN